MFDINIFCERLKLLRLDKNLTQEHLAKAIQSSKGAIANYENGNRQPGLETLVNLADFFHVSVDYLLGRTDVKTMRKTRKEISIQKP